MVNITKAFIQECYEIITQTKSRDFKDAYTLHMRKFLETYPDIDGCILHAIELNEICGERLGRGEIERAVHEFDRLCKERSVKQKADRSWLFPICSVPMLSLDNRDHWASNSQILSGRVLQHILLEEGIRLPEYMAICLNPTGGIPGPGNIRFFDTKPGSVLSVHSSIHDSSGYAKVYHEAGNGYNYMCSRFEILSAISPRSGQLSGLLYCYLYKP